MRTANERIDVFGGVIRNESRKLPGHEDRMVAHCERVQRDEDVFRDRIKKVKHEFKIRKNHAKKCFYNKVKLGELTLKCRADIRVIRDEWLGSG